MDETMIEICRADNGETVWAVRGHQVPEIGDTVTIENADDSTRRYAVKAREWLTAKQGESSFARVRLIVADVPKEYSYNLLNVL